MAQAYPITYVTPSPHIPAFLIVHGDQDPLVPYNQSELLAAALASVGADHQLDRVVAGGHGGPAVQSDEIRALVDRFVDRRLGPNQPREHDSPVSLS